MACGRAIILALAAAAILLAPSDCPAKPWRHAVVVPGSDAGFAVMVKQGGFADKQGLELQWLPLQGDAVALHAVLAGEIDSYEGGPGAAIVAAGRRDDVKIIGCSWQSVAHSVFAHSVFDRAQDLRGQFIAVSAPMTLPDLVARAWLVASGVSPAEVRFTSLAGDEERYKALTGGLVAATVISIEFQPVAEAAGLKLLARGSEVVPNIVRLCVMATGATLAARREDAIRFLAAEMNALRFALGHREEEIAATRKVTGAELNDPRLGHIFAEAARPGGVDPTLPIPLDKLAWMEDLLIRAGDISAPFDPRRMVDPDIRAEAQARVGKK